MTDVSPGRLVFLGRVSRPHGVRGLLRVQSSLDSEAAFTAAGSVTISLPSGQRRQYVIASAKKQKNFFLVALQGLETRDAADELRGADIFIHEGAVSREEDEYLWRELLGLDVYLEDGRRLGIITRIIPTGGADIYVIAEGNKELLIPATVDVIKEVDLEARRMEVAAIEGLLELYEF